MSAPTTNIVAPIVRQRRVVCAALLNADGSLVIGPRHFDETMRKQIEQSRIPVVSCEQGFIDQFGKFMKRDEALKVAQEANQILVKTSLDNILFSEDIY